MGERSGRGREKGREISLEALSYDDFPRELRKKNVRCGPMIYAQALRTSADLCDDAWYRDSPAGPNNATAYDPTMCIPIMRVSQSRQ